MGRFDHLAIRDSDSDSSAEPTPANDVRTPQAPGEHSQTTREAQLKARGTPGDAPDAIQPAASDTRAAASRQSALQSPFSASRSGDGGQEFASCHSSPAYSGTGVSAPETPAAPSIGPVQRQLPARDDGSIVPSAAPDSVLSGALSAPSRGLPVRRATPASTHSLQTPVDQPQRLPQPLSIAKDESPAASALPGPTSQGSSHAGQGTETTGPGRRLTTAFRTPTSSSTGVRSSRSQHSRSGTRQSELSAASSRRTSDKVHQNTNSSGESNQDAAGLTGLSEKEESVNTGRAATPPSAPHPVPDEQEGDEQPANRPGSEDPKTVAQVSSSASQQQLSGSRSSSVLDSTRHSQRGAAPSPQTAASHDVANMTAVPNSAEGQMRAGVGGNETSAAATGAVATAAAPKKKKAKSGCRLFSFCCRKKADADDRPLVATEHEAAAAVPVPQGASVASSVGQRDGAHSVRVSSRGVRSVSIHMSASELDTPNAEAAARSGASAHASTPQQASGFAETQFSNPSAKLSSPHRTPPDTTNEIALGARSPASGEHLRAAESVDLSNEAHVSAAAAAKPPSRQTTAESGFAARGNAEPAKRRKRMRVRKQRGELDENAAEKASRGEEKGDARTVSSRPSLSKDSVPSSLASAKTLSSHRGTQECPAVAANRGNEEVCAAALVASAPEENDTPSDDPMELVKAVGQRSPAPMVLLADRARTPTPNDVAYPIPDDPHRRNSSTAIVRSVHSEPVSENPSSSYQSSPHSGDSSRTPDSRTHANRDPYEDEATSHASYSYSDPERYGDNSEKAAAGREDVEFPDTTEAAGLTTEANDLLTNGLDEDELYSARAGEKPPLPPHLQKPLLREAGDAEELRRLPPYQRRLLVDMRAKQRRELEELAKDWPELTFRPAINPSPHCVIKNKMPFGDRLSRSHPTSPGVTSLGSGEATSDGATPRATGSRCTYTGEPTPTFTPEISAYAQSRPKSPQKVFDRLQEKPKTRPPPETAEARECTFTPEVSEGSRQLAPTTDVFTRLSRLPKRTAEGPAAAPVSKPTSPRRQASRPLSGHPSPRRNSASGADEQDGTEKSVFERLYRQRKTPDSSPQTTPQRSGRNRCDHQPQITATARRLSANRPLADSDFGERLYRKRLAKQQAAETASGGPAAKGRHTPFYPDSVDSADEHTPSADKAQQDATGRSCLDDTFGNGFRSGYYGSASGSDSGSRGPQKLGEIPTAA